MGESTKIAWCEHTWNPWIGCQRVSQGCVHCYAEVWAKGRAQRDVWGSPSKRQRTGRPVWKNPTKWNYAAQVRHTPARTFCGSLMDIFEDAPGPNQWRTEAWEVMHRTPWLDWLLLTKRPENIARMLPDTWAENQWGHWPNVWLGTSIEDNRVAERSPILTTVPAEVHFISYEPAIGMGDEIPLEHIEWVICGGESGPGYRKMNLTWATIMWMRCVEAKVAYFFKQNSGPRTEMGIDALGRVIREYPKTWDRAEMLSHAG